MVTAEERKEEGCRDVEKLMLIAIKHVIDIHVSVTLHSSCIAPLLDTPPPPPQPLLSIIPWHASSGPVDPESEPCCGHRDGDESFYPAYLVCATSAMGVALARRLAAWHLLGARASWLLQCIHAAKLSMLLLPDAFLVFPTLGLLITATAPLADALGAPPARDGAAAAPPPVGGGSAARPLDAPLVAAIVLAVAHARFAIFDVATAVYGGPPPEGVLLGALLVTAAACLAPLVYTTSPHTVVRPSEHQNASRG
jgi:hypothetical protein